MSGIYFRKISIKSGRHFGTFGIRNGYVFEASMARARPKSGQVPPPRVSVILAMNKSRKYTDKCFFNSRINKPFPVDQEFPWKN